MKKIRLLILLILSFLILPVSPVLAVDFSPEFVVSDFDMEDYESMTLEGIQEFLKNQTGILKNYYDYDVDNAYKSAAEIIYNAAQSSHISPKFLLVLLQREQSLITDPDPVQGQLDWAMGYAVCDSCDTDDPFVKLYKGFAKQVDSAAWRIRYYTDNWQDEDWIKRADQTYEIDGQIVVPMNQATANLYTYTPHIHGNKNFWLIWNDWFTKMYPDGTLVSEHGSSGVYLIDHGSKRPFLTYSALISRYDPNLIVKVSPGELQAYETGSPIKHPQYSLLNDENNNTYLLVNDALRRITTPEVFKNLGFNPEEVVQVANSDILMYKQGAVIDMDSVYPAGALLQNKETGGVYFVKDSLKHPIKTRDLMEINYPNRNLTMVSAEELENYQTAEPVNIPDGMLVSPTSSPAVYVISNGEKRPILSSKIFESLGYNWDNVKQISDSSLGFNELGLAIESDMLNSNIASISSACSSCNLPENYHQ